MYVELQDICKSFGDFEASKHVSFGIERGSLTAFLGPSGSGKTTILRMIAGLENPDSGEIRIDGKVVNDVPGNQRGVGFVFQNYALFRYMTVYDNIAFGLKVQKWDKKRIEERVLELIELVGLKGMEKRYPNQLSGGQKQRVAFARALAPNPQLLLLDEPFAAIDAKVRAELRGWLKNMIHQVGITSIFVTHDQDEAVEVADEIVVINEGRVEQMGTPLEVYQNPATTFVAHFIGNSEIISETKNLHGFGDITGSRQAVLKPEFIEAIKLDNNKFDHVLDACEEGTIENIAFRGKYYELKIRLSNGLVVTTERGLERRMVEEGEMVRVLLYRMYQFDENGGKLVENSALAGKEIQE